MFKITRDNIAKYIFFGYVGYCIVEFIFYLTKVEIQSDDSKTTVFIKNLVIQPIENFPHIVSLSLAGIGLFYILKAFIKILPYLRFHNDDF